MKYLIFFFFLFSVSAFAEVSTSKHQKLVREHSKLTKKYEDIKSSEKKLYQEKNSIEKNYITACNYLNVSINTKMNRARKSDKSLDESSKVLKSLDQKNNSKKVILEYMIFNGKIEKAKDVLLEMHHELEAYVVICNPSSAFMKSANATYELAKEFYAKLQKHDQKLTKILSN